jgi:tRNA A-37 threonylcarbamoyl transferase component Bud32
VSELLDKLRQQLGAVYRIERELGGGGMSRVFVAEEMALGRRVVLKVLPPELAPALSPERFEREVRVAARLQHPHVVQLLAAGRSADALYYTMPLVEGESLRTRLDRQRELPVTEAARLFREIADALAYAHREGVVHRDIKPDNIMLSHGHAMVTDFGVARAVSEAGGDARLTQTGIAVGTPAYMSPEQAAGEERIDHRADLYALGVVAYEMLAGQPPFRASTFQALVAAVLTQAPAPLTTARPSVPRELAAIVHRCMEKRPADRYQDAAELAAALDRVVPSHSHVDSVAVAATTLEQPTTGGITRRRLLGGGLALGLLGLGFAGGIAVGRSRAGSPPSYQRLTFRRGMIRTARFAPDFRTVLYGALWDGGVCRVYTVRPESPESSALSLPPAAPLAVSASGELALALGTHLRGIMPYGTLARVPLAGGAPRELQEHVKYADWSPVGDELAIVRRVSDVDHIEFPVGTRIAEPVNAGGGFSFLRVSRRGDAVAAFELDERANLYGRVVVFDRAGVRQVESGKYFNVFGLAWKDDEVWFTAADALPLFRNTIYAMSTAGDVRIIARVPGNTSLHDIAPDGRLLIARTDDRSGMAVRAPGEERDRDLSWLDSSVLVDISADGSRILFHEGGVGGGPGGSVYVRGTDGSPAVRLGAGMAQALSPDGRWALVRSATDAAHFDIVPTGAGQVGRLERPGLRILGARWLADGRSVVVRAQPQNGQPRLYRLGIADDSVQPVTPEGVPLTGSWAVAPGGDRVAITTTDGVSVFPMSGGAGRAVPATSGRSVAGWIQQGLLLTGDAESSVVYRVDPDTGAGDTWTDVSPQDPAGIMNLEVNALAVTPDGRGYGYRWHRATSDLYLVEGIG